MEGIQVVEDAIIALHDVTAKLQQRFGLDFPLDGILVRDLGFALAKALYGFSTADVYGHHGIAQGKNVQIGTTFRDSVRFAGKPEHYLAFQLCRDGSYKEVYNGPGQLVCDEFQGRKHIGAKAVSLPLDGLSGIYVPLEDRISRTHHE